MRQRPTPTLVIALLALVVALSPAAIAVGKALIGTSDIKNGAITTKKLKNGAVTLPKIRKGVVPMTKPSRTVWVHAGGTPQNNGARLRQAVAKLPASSVNNGVSIELDAGSYALGSTGIKLPAGAVLNGRGRWATFITSTGAVAVTIPSGAHHAELRNLSIATTGASAAVVADAILDGANVNVTADYPGHTARAIDARNGFANLRDCTVEATGDSALAIESNNPQVYGCNLYASGTLFSIGLNVDTSAGHGFLLQDSRIDTGQGGTGYGLSVFATSTGVVLDSVIEGGGSNVSGGAVYLAQAGFVQIRNSRIIGTGVAPAIRNVTGNVRLGATQIGTGAATNGIGAGSRICIGSFTAFYTAVGANCE